MKEIIRVIKAWWKLANPGKKETIIQIIFILLITGIKVLLPIPAAKAVTSLTQNSYQVAFYFIIFLCSIEVTEEFFWHQWYMSWKRGLIDIYQRLQEKVYDKLLISKASTFKKITLEKIINIISIDLYNLADFQAMLTQKVGNVVRIVSTIIIVTIMNVYVGLFLLLITLFNYYLLNFLNDHKVKWVKKRKEAKDNYLNEIALVIKEKNIINKFNLKEEKRKEYNKVIGYYLDQKKKEFKWISILDNWTWFLYHILKFLVTSLLIYLMYKQQLTLTLYLIIVPYLGEMITETKTFYGILEQIKNLNINIMRVNTVLKLKEDDLIAFGNNNNDDVNGTIEFNEVSYEDEENGRISEISFILEKGSINIIKGLSKSGKRQIFYLLNRTIKQNSGNIFLDNISIFEYTEKVYKTNVNSITYKPIFFNGTIIQNLKMIEKSKGNIIEMTKRLGIHEKILSLPNGYKTHINKNTDKISEELRFLIGLTRTLLTNSEVIMIYEFPTKLNKDEIKNIKNVLKELKGEKTFIIFTAQDTIDDLPDKTIEIKWGKVENITKQNHL